MDTKPIEVDPCELLKMSSGIVAAHVGNNLIEADDVSTLLSSVHATLLDLSSLSKSKFANTAPAVPVAESIQDDYLICLEDGRKLKMLKRHLNTVFGLSPDQYRTKWGLPSNYPMVAPNYALKRQELAKKIGLGKRRKP